MNNDVFEVLSGAVRRDRLGRVILEKSLREGLLMKFHASGMSQAKFARREGLNATTFSGWVRAARACDAGESHAGEPTSTLTGAVPADHPFRELRIESTSPAAVTPVTLTVVLPGGIEIRGCDARSAVELIRSLREVR